MDIAKQLQEYFEADGRIIFERTTWPHSISHYQDQLLYEGWQAAKASDRALILALLGVIERQAEALRDCAPCCEGVFEAIVAEALEESAPLIEVAKKWREKV